MTKIMEKAPGKREARKEERREAILAIAKRVFLDQGYSGASMSAISAELGGSKGTLWSYFPSKEELFAARVLASLCLGVQQRMIWGQELSAAERDREAGEMADIFLRAFAPE